MEPQPQLATAWEFSPDNAQLTFHLRQGVKFHSGKPFTSEDVAFNIGAGQQKENNSQLRVFAAAIVKTETPDPQTVVLHFNQPQPTIFDMFEYLLVRSPCAPWPMCKRS
ncbi:MAG: ABC transporter substrate-binding protein [Dehalococcoidia bacterium]